MTYLDAAESAKQAELWARHIPAQTNDQAIINLAQTLGYLAKSQRELAEQLHRDS